ncbi:MAG: colicin V production protein [Sodalis sp. Psp]|nr:colicin V production protein [Sodalis sp. Psp]MCR3757070.1 colicin V production protein [Sodalis sp. Ppy]
MIWIDYVIISIIIFSSFVSLIRGFVREVLSLVIWICAFFITNHCYSYLAVYFTRFKEQAVRNGIAIILLFVVILIIGTIINYAITSLVEQAGLSGTDRIVGVCFGALRGIMIVSALLFFFDTFIGFSHIQNLQQSQLIPQFSGIIKWLLNLSAKHVGVS